MVLFLFSILTHIGLTVDFQALIHLGFVLTSLTLLLNGKLHISLLCYGLSLNCSLDGLLLFPYFLVIIVSKILRDIHRER